MIGLETSIRVLSATLHGEPIGTPKEFRGDAVATAKHDLKPARRSTAKAALPYGRRLFRRRGALPFAGC